MKKIVFINQEAGYLMIDIINAYVKEGYDCILITGRLIERNKLLDKKVKVEKIIRYNRKNLIQRLWTWLLAFLQIFIKIFFKYKDAELFIVSNPPLATLIPYFTTNQFSLLIYDIYPDGLISTGFFSEKSPIIKFWKKLNKHIYPHAQRLVTLTEGMKDVLSQYSEKEKIEIIPIWTDNELLKPIEKSINPFIAKYNLRKKFIVMYSGSLGRSHEIEIMIDLALLTKDPDILYLIVGDGEKKRILQEKIINFHLNNCLLLPFQDSEIFPFSIASADIAIVSLGKGTSKLCIPSKIYNLLSVGVPIIGIASNDSELHDMINEFKIGECFQSFEKEKIVNFIIELKNNPNTHKKYASNALKTSSNYDSKNVNKFLKKDMINP